MVVSNGKGLPDNGNGNNDCGNDDNDRDNDNRPINLPDTAVAAAADDDNDEGMPRKTLVTTMIRRKKDSTNADIPEGGVSNGPMTKLRQYSSLTFEASTLPRSGCS